MGERRRLLKKTTLFEGDPKEAISFEGYPFSDGSTCEGLVSKKKKSWLVLSSWLVNVFTDPIMQFEVGVDDKPILHTDYQTTISYSRKYCCGEFELRE